MDEAVLRRLLLHIGAGIGPIHRRNGKDSLRRRVSAFNNAARHSPWIVVVDLNHEAHCAPPLRASWLPSPAPGMCFRVAVREIESWIMADRARLARYLRVQQARVPSDPEALDDPKTALVNLARTSTKKAVREDMVPRLGSGRKIGPAYTSRLIEFVSDQERGWRPDVAAAGSDSLGRCLRSLRNLVHS